MSNVEEFRKILTANGHRLTSARERTFALLVNPEPQTMNEILRRAGKDVDRVSIYRNIDLFEKLGIAKRIYFGWKYKIELSDKFLKHHHHLVCLNCGSVTDIHDEEHIADYIEQVSAERGFTPLRHTFEIEGYCSKCRKTAGEG